MNVNLDMFSPEFIADPHPMFQKLQSETPVYWSEQLGAWLLSRYSDVSSALKDLRLSSECADYFFRGLPPEVMSKIDRLYKSVCATAFSSDPPKQSTLRAIARKACTPDLMSRIEESMDNIIDELLAKIIREGHADLVREFSIALPAMLTADLLGMPRAEYQRLIYWGDQMLRFHARAPGDIAGAEQGYTVFTEIMEYWQQRVAVCRRGEETFLARLILGAEEARLDDAVIDSIPISMSIGGIQTISDMISNALYYLVSDAEELSRVRRSPEFVDATVEEAIRMAAPVQLLIRVAKEDVTIAGQKIRQGQIVMMLLEAANHDPREFECPAKFDSTREHNRHIAFGHGKHHCPGAVLARPMTRKAIEKLLVQRNDMHIHVERIEWQSKLFQRSVKSLPVTVVRDSL